MAIAANKHWLLFSRSFAREFGKSLGFWLTWLVLWFIVIQFVDEADLWSRLVEWIKGIG